MQLLKTIENGSINGTNNFIELSGTIEKKYNFETQIISDDIKRVSKFNADYGTFTLQNNVITNEITLEFLATPFNSIKTPEEILKIEQDITRIIQGK